jgi:anti-sigma regulatory factor (Ser/Thr protein kinase)
MPASPEPRAERDLVLSAEGSAVFAFEDFADGLDFLPPIDRCRIKIAGSEILDNIVKHASPLDGGTLRVRAARRGGSVTLAFYFRSTSFASFASGEGAFGEGPASREPFFDPTHRRWRGIGLVMCRNLSTRLVFRPGSRMDRIFLEF